MGQARAAGEENKAAPRPTASAAVGLLRLVGVFENGDATLRKLARHWEPV